MNDTRRYELGRPAANTKLCGSGVHPLVRQVRCRGGNRKFRALRLDSGNFSWGSEALTRKTRVLDVVYNASNNELVSSSFHQPHPPSYLTTPLAHLLKNSISPLSRLLRFS